MKIIRWFKTIRELNEAHDAQNAVLRKMQAELDALRIKHDNLLKFSTDCVVIILDLKSDLARMQAELDALRSICNGLVIYRQRTGPLNFQLEKADHWMRLLAQALGKVIK